jgi:hypothetical protein
MAADDHIFALATLFRGRQTPFQVYGRWLDDLLQPRPQRAALAQVLFKAGRKLVALGEARREIVLERWAVRTVAVRARE